MKRDKEIYNYFISQVVFISVLFMICEILLWCLTGLGRLL